MFECKIRNTRGLMKLTGKEAIYQVISIQGLNPPNAQINTATIVGLDGTVFNSSRLESRNIVLQVKINGDVETNRLNLYSYFVTKEKVTFYFKNDTLDVWIDGYVDTVECDLFSNAEFAQISIICPFPYFQSLTQEITDSSNTTALFEFPFSINADDPIPISEIIPTDSFVVANSSDGETGCEIDIIFNEDVSDVEIRNVTTGDDFVLHYSFEEGDEVVINTVKGQKSIQLIRDGVISNLFSAMQMGSKFIQLQSGSNVIQFTADDVVNSSAVVLLFRLYETYRGV